MPKFYFTNAFVKDNVHFYSGIRSKLVYAYKLVDAGFTISGIGVRAGFILFKDKPIL